ncbi:hypothetical protein CHLNCDRAFT_57000 [Chlorella variabilis]|uniref:CSC1/OSCA1-like 7TM region domain-containing protein n=1 Tax=Chlorella variabilis TaxID=554065 RepID=E1Z791_CHLVA|nr:hypothetical protein CHLNCDRAFT_57000 [Chlorella variabilis]EFN57874.1 hypothetical protein CHLNCDRAFT_57000 [Chlorella variabilis]|eukprot:XP_005849976.1 hypothetical protein CHLNCDRAFT_57000 [Chlorella variabilis]
MAAAAPPPPLPPPPPPSLTAETLTSRQLAAAAVASAVGGAFFLALWAFVRGPLRHIYQKRTQITDLHARPPPMRVRGLLHRCLGFLAPVFLLTDAELLQTAGLDALMLCRFLALGLQVFVPISALCCAVLVPLTRTGTAVEDSAEYANTAELMRYTLSNVEEGSPKLWAPFALSYVVLGYTGYVLLMHYKSYALLRLLHQRLGMRGAAADGPPSMAIVGMERRGWKQAASLLLTLISPLHMHHQDAKHVREVMAVHDAAELAAARSAAADGSPQAAAGDMNLEPAQTAAFGGSSSDGDDGGEEAEDEEAAGCNTGAGSAGASVDGSKLARPDSDGMPVVLPWWLPPEQVPAEVSAELGTSGVISGKSCCVLRGRVRGVTPAGRTVWAQASQYAVLWTVIGPPPSRELHSLLRSRGPSPRLAPPSIRVDGGGSQQAEADGGGGAGSQGMSKGGSRGGSSASLAPGNPQQAGPEADAIAGHLARSLKEFFPQSFSRLVRVHDHLAVDRLLAKHEDAATCRDRALTAVAAARASLSAAEAAPSAGPAQDGGGSGKAGGGGSGSGGGRKAARAAARLARAEAGLAKWQGRVEELEQQIVAARQHALARPLGTAFIALFRTQAAAMMAARLESSVLPSGNFSVQLAPGPDNINWPALWTPWLQRVWRGLAVIPLLAVVMLFPIGTLTGALSNLNTAVCGGSPETNKLYWPWYCQSRSFGAELMKELLQGLLPAILSTCWDTYVLPLAFYFLAQSGQRHLALSDLDRRITALFYCFSVSNTFLMSVLGGAVFQQIGSLVTNPTKWLQLLATALPSASIWFMDYLVVHALAINVWRFAWPHDGTVLFVLFRGVGLFRPNCERDRCMIRSTPSLRSGRHYGAFLLIQIMALSYAVIAPLLLPMAAFYFLTAWVTWRYCVLHFYERSYESGGRIFEILFTLVVWTGVLFTLFSSLVLASKKAWSPCLLMLATQLPMLYVYHRKVQLSVGHYARVVPMQSTLQAPKVEVDPATYLPPPLRPGAVGWYPEWGKVWEKYGISRHSW